MRRYNSVLFSLDLGVLYVIVSYPTWYNVHRGAVVMAGPATHCSPCHYGGQGESVVPPHTRGSVSLSRHVIRHIISPSVLSSSAIISFKLLCKGGI